MELIQVLYRYIYNIIKYDHFRGMFKLDMRYFKSIIIYIEIIFGSVHSL